jgi:GNAT superfamily N-acetyltransferase
MENVRPAGLDDLNELVTLAGAAHGELAPTRGGYVFVNREARWVRDEGAFRVSIEAPDHHVVVGTIDEVPVGFGAVRLEALRSGETLGVIDELFVLPGARGVGVGEVMMNELLAFCRDHGCMGIDAVALPGNRATKNFFETFGLVARAILVHRSLVEAAPED